MKKYYLSAIYDPLNPRATFNPKEFRFISNKLNSISEKKFKMDVENNWEGKEMDLRTATKFGFKTSQEVISLVEYSESNYKMLIALSGSSNEDEEKNAYRFQSTRIWESVDLAKKIAAELKKGKSYDEITEEFNLKLKNLGIDYRFNPAYLRKVISHAYEKLGKEKLKLFLGKV